MRYSFSSFELYDNCKHAWKCRYRDKLPGEENAPQITGKQAHRFAEHYVRDCLKNKVKMNRNFLNGYLWEAPNNLLQELDEMAERFIDSFIVDFKNPLVERKIAFNSKWQPLDDFFSDQAFFRLVMDLFFVEDGAFGPLGVITDYKTSWKLPTQKEVDNSLQLKIYSFAAFLLYPEVEEVIPRLFFLRYGVMKTRSEPYTRSDIADVPELIQQKVEEIEAEKDFKPSLNRLCGWCGYTPYCPLFKNSLTKVIGYDLQTFKDAQQAAGILYAAKLACDKLTARLKEYVDQFGPISLEDMKLGYNKSEGLEFDAEEVVTILGTEGVPKDIIWSTLGVTKTSLKRALKGTANKLALEKALASGTKKIQTRFGWGKI